MSAAPPTPSRTALLDHPLLREGRLWQAGSLGRCQSRTFSSGFAALDAELPGGGWPSQSLCEILQPPGQHAEWRLLAPALRRLFAAAPTGGSSDGDAMGSPLTAGRAKDGSPTQSSASGGGSSSSTGASNSSNSSNSSGSRGASKPCHPSSSGSAGSRFAGSSASAMPPILLIAPPFVPHGPGLLDLGLEAAQWVWIKTTPEPDATGPGAPDREGSLGRGGARRGAHQAAHQAAHQTTYRAPSKVPLEAWHEELHEELHGAMHEAMRQRRHPQETQRASLQSALPGSRRSSQQGEPRGRPAIGPARCQQALHQALWVAEQAIKSQAAGAVLAWLDGAQPEQIRRLQAAALNSPVPIFLMRPDSAATQSSAAPLRLRLSQPAASRGLAPGLLEILLIKRRGPAMVQPLQLHSLPPRLQQSLPARLRQGVAPPQPPAHAVEPARTQQAPGIFSPRAWSSAPEVEA